MVGLVAAPIPDGGHEPTGTVGPGQSSPEPPWPESPPESSPPWPEPPPSTVVVGVLVLALVVVVAPWSSSPAPWCGPSLSARAAVVVVAGASPPASRPRGSPRARRSRRARPSRPARRSPRARRSRRARPSRPRRLGRLLGLDRVGCLRGLARVLVWAAGAAACRCGCRRPSPWSRGRRRRGRAPRRGPDERITGGWSSSPVSLRQVGGPACGPASPVLRQPGSKKVSAGLRPRRSGDSRGRARPPRAAGRTGRCRRPGRWPTPPGGCASRATRCTSSAVTASIAAR